MLKNRIMVFVTFWTLVNVLLAPVLRDSFHYAATRLMINRTEGDYLLFHHSADFSFNIANVTQSHSSLVRLFSDTTSTAEDFICETNVVCDVNCVRKQLSCIVVYLNINQLDALNFIMSLFHACTCFEHTCSSSVGQNCTIQPLVSSHWNKWVV